MPTPKIYNEYPLTAKEVLECLQDTEHKYFIDLFNFGYLRGPNGASNFSTGVTLCCHFRDARTKGFSVRLQGLISKEVLVAVLNHPTLKWVSDVLAFGNMLSVVHGIFNVANQQMQECRIDESSMNGKQLADYRKFIGDRRFEAKRVKALKELLAASRNPVVVTSYWKAISVPKSNGDIPVECETWLVWQDEPGAEYVMEGRNSTKNADAIRRRYRGMPELYSEFEDRDGGSVFLLFVHIGNGTLHSTSAQPSEAVHD